MARCADKLSFPVSCRFRIALPAALVTFRRKHPKMHVQIREGVTSAVHEDVRSGIADFGIGNVLGLAEGVVAESIVQEACYVVMPKRHRLGALSFVSLKDFGAEPMISMPSDSGLRSTFDTVANDRCMLFNPRRVTNHVSARFG